MEVFVTHLCVVLFLIENGLSKRPNVVFILADDLDMELNGTFPLAKTRKLIAENGANFTNMYVPNPLSCPSRASILSGMYSHNHGVFNNSVSGGCYGHKWRREWEKLTVGMLLQKENYKTFFAGLYMDEYGTEAGGEDYTPVGWDSWNLLVGKAAYYNYSVINNGEKEVHGDNYSVDYFTDYVKNKSVEFLQNLSPESDPFFMFIAPPACSAPFTSAPQYVSLFSKEKAPRTKNYDVPGTDKHWVVASAPNPMSDAAVSYTDQTFQNRWRTLLSLDDLVESVVNELDATNVLNDTFIFFTSDSGYHLGQFSLPSGSCQPYESDIHVPLFVKGPGIKPGSKYNTPVLSIDLVATIVDLANVTQPASMDGRSFKSVLWSETNTTITGRQFLIQHYGQGVDSQLIGCNHSTVNQTDCLPLCVCEDSFNNTYSCVRSIGTSLGNSLYCEFADAKVSKTLR
jgi:N-acetylglucosamine-6-sulfatase